MFNELINEIANMPIDELTKMLENNGVKFQSDTEIMIEISRELLIDIYNELVCCRRLREQELYEYKANYNEYEIDLTQVEIFEDSIEHTRKLYNSIKDAIEKFLNDEYDLNEAMECDADTDFENVKIVK